MSNEQKPALQPAAKPKVAACPICGHKMVIPPGYENKPGKCPGCGSIVTPSSESILESLYETTRPASVQSAPPKKKPRESLLTTLIRGAVVGLIGAVIGGVITALMVRVVRSRAESLNIKSLLMSADIGITLGFVVCSGVVIIKKLAAGPVGGMLVGIAISLVVNTLCYLFEWALVTKPDQPFLLSSVVALLAGLVAGVVLGNTVGSPKD